jgi:2-methylfumaryl-CoA isomerase
MWFGGHVLGGVSVVEVASFVAGPTAGLTLAQLGADVVRVDPVGGGPDVDRWPLDSGRSLYWAGLNRGKRSVVLDLNTAEGRQHLHRLLAQPGENGGILVTNVAGKEWLAPDALRELRSDLVHVQVLGTRDGATAVDYTVNAATGLPCITGSGDGAVNHALPAWDLLCGMHAAVTVLAALHRRRVTGHGTFATIALDDVAASTLTTLGFTSEAHLTGTNRPALGNAIYGSYGADMQLADGSRVIVVALTPRHWRDLVAVTETARVFDVIAAELDVDFGDEGERFRHRDLINAVLRPWFAARFPDEVAAALRGTSVLWSPFRTLLDLARDLADGAAEPVVTTRDDGFSRPVLATTGPVRRPREPAPAPRPAPRLGEHTDDVAG